jgi:hypothetical protein
MKKNLVSMICLLVGVLIVSCGNKSGGSSGPVVKPLTLSHDAESTENSESTKTEDSPEPTVVKELKAGDVFEFRFSPEESMLLITLNRSESINVRLEVEKFSKIGPFSDDSIDNRTMFVTYMPDNHDRLQFICCKDEAVSYNREFWIWFEGLNTGMIQSDISIAKLTEEGLSWRLKKGSRNGYKLVVMS